MRKGSLADASGSFLFSSFIKPKHDHSHEAHKDGHPEINIQKPVVHKSVILLDQSAYKKTDHRKRKTCNYYFPGSFLQKTAYNHSRKGNFISFKHKRGYLILKTFSETHISKLNVYHPKSTMSAKEAA